MNDSHRSPPANGPAAIIPPSGPALTIVEGHGSIVKDSDGRSYIDLEAGPGVSSVGHCHPRVVSAIRDQAGKLIHSPGAYASDLSASLVQRLSNLTGGHLNRTFFCNSGAEANDGAVKLALKYSLNSGKQGFGIFALEHSFHGRLSLPLSLTGMAERKKGFGPYASFPAVIHVPAPYCYRCPLKLQPKDCGIACADVVEERMKTAVPGEAAVMIAEPILGAGGIIIPPKAYWTKISQICKRYKVTLILDEVFTGFGRTGKMFAHEHYETSPNIMTFAKAIGGGTPFAGFTAQEAVGDAFEKGDHNSTFGVRNQIGLAAAHAVLDILEDEKLVDGATRQGKRFMAGLRKIAELHECIGDVRGEGLMIGVELVNDPSKRDPATVLARKIPAEMAKRGVLMQPTGVDNNILRITPPLVITDKEVDAVLDRFDDCLTKLSESVIVS